MSSFRYRSHRVEGDYAAMARLRSLITGEQVEAAQLSEYDSLLPEGSILHRVMAEDQAGQVVGFGEAYRFPNTLKGKFYLYVAVDPAHRGQGAGSRLTEAVEGFTAGQKATLLVAESEDRDAGSLAYAQRRGYSIRRHGYTSWLDLTRFDPAPFAPLLAAARQGGLRYFTLADDPSDAMKQALYRFYAETMPDIPGYEAERFMGYETWHKLVAENTGTRPDWVFLAAEGSRLAGVTTAVERQGYVYTNHTLVHPDFRGRKTALTLKLLAIQAARQSGATRMSTGNDSRNAPMLAVNRRLGYVPESGTYELVKHLDA